MVEDALCPNGCKSIVDTGTYLIYGPSDQLQTFLADMTIRNCEEKSRLPNLGFMFKGYPKDGKDTAFELILTPDDYVLEFEVDGKNDCVVGIGSDNEDSGWTLGQVFLKAYYTVFDRDNEAIGFVKSNPNPHEFMKKQNTGNAVNENLFIAGKMNSNNNSKRNFMNTNMHFIGGNSFNTNNSASTPITPSMNKFNLSQNSLNNMGFYDYSSISNLPNGPIKAADENSFIGAMSNSFLK